MQEERGVLTPDLYVLVFKEACGWLDLYTYKNISQTCRLFRRLMKEHVPYKALELSTEEDEDSTLSMLYNDVNNLLTVPRPFSLFFLTDAYDSMSEVANVIQEWWDENTSFTCVVREPNFTSVKPEYVVPNMLCILVDDSDWSVLVSEATWSMVRLILKASGRVIVFKYCDMAHMVNPPIEKLMSKLITHECSALLKR